MFIPTLLLLLANNGPAESYVLTRSPVSMSTRKYGNSCGPNSYCISPRSSRGSPYTSFLKEFDTPLMTAQKLMDIFDGWESLGDVSGHFLPLDVKETPTNFQVFIDVPGVEKDSVNIEIKNHVLTVTADRKALTTEEATASGETIRRRERTYGTSSRSLRLPEGVDEDKVEATFENGVLTLTVPKLSDEEKEKALGIKKVQIA